MMGPIFHLPDAATMASIGTGLLMLSLLWWHRPNPFAGMWDYFAYLFALGVTRTDLHYWVMAAYAWWLFFGRRFPWDRWRRKLASKLASMTEVAKAAFQRQQSEAFS